ncbi:MAG: PorV/PorQ family protein [Flavobacteriia bacterium]|nr:PorV/PorQ family protein [Flavobacteriia bacterium]OJX36802.1 MAG: hypothetical protein BGO87_13520 [Flavobacteriia bacterium 40-80]
MKRKEFNILNWLVIGATVFSCSILKAGNEDRVGAAGATQLLVNPWARSTAVGDASVSSINGIEATFINIAGLATVEKTQIKANYTNWLGNAKINYISAGIAQKIGDAGVISVGLQAMNFGEIMRTTVDNPEGGLGVFIPKVNVFSLGYAKMFTPSIHGGIQIKVINESIANASSTGIALDAGVRYQTGKNDRLKIGITLKNVGPAMKYKGDGFQTQAVYVATGATGSVQQRSQGYELPSLLSMGVSYDIFLGQAKTKSSAKYGEESTGVAKEGKAQHILTPMFAFTANSFGNDQLRVGLDYGFTATKVAFNLRAGYVYEKNILNVENRTNALTGLTAGFSVDAITKSKSALGIEYAVRLSSPFGVIHTVGLAISLK